MTGETHPEAIINLIMQFFMVTLLLFGYWLFKIRKYMYHGVMAVALTLLHAISFFYNMVPVFISELGHFIGELSEPIVALTIAHSVLGVVAEILTIYLVLRWAIHRFDIKRCVTKLGMRLTFYVWITALFSGILIFVSHLME